MLVLAVWIVGSRPPSVARRALRPSARIRADFGGRDHERRPAGQIVVEPALEHRPQHILHHIFNARPRFTTRFALSALKALSIRGADI